MPKGEGLVAGLHLNSVYMPCIYSFSFTVRYIRVSQGTLGVLTKHPFFPTEERPYLRERNVSRLHCFPLRGDARTE